MEVKRPLLLAVGLTMLALGFVGTVLPLLPATPFFLAAAWFFSRSSPRLEKWLLNLPVVGEPMRDWQEHGAIGTGPKFMALGAIGLCAIGIVQLSRMPTVVNGLVLLVMFVVVAFILSRPNAPGRR
jgi:uncharacterized membrane protein YbaN (DUF454 family)